METCTTDRRALELHRVENRHRIDESGTARRPLHLTKNSLCLLVAPLEGDGVSRKLRGTSEAEAIGDVLVDQYEAIRREIVVLNRLREPLYRFRDRILRHMLILDDIEALCPEKFILRRTGVLEIHIFALRIHGAHECEGHQIHMTGFRHLRVQLTYRARTEIPRILILRIRIRDGFVDLFKFGIRDDGLSAEHQITGEGNPRRDVIKHPRVLCDDFTDLTVATGDRLHQLPGMVAQDDGEPVHLPAEKALFISQPGGQFLDGLRLIEAQHRARMALLRKLRQHLEADTLGRRAAENHAGLLLELLKLIIELVIAQVRHDLIAIHIVHAGRFIQGADELLHTHELLILFSIMGNTHISFTPYLLPGGRARTARSRDTAPASVRAG